MADIKTITAPRPSRRSLLSFLTASAAVAGAATTAAATAVAPLPPILDEHPEILALGRRVDELTEALNQARDRHQQSRRDFQSLCPAMPSELVAPNSDRDLSNIESDIDEWIVSDDQGRRRIYNSRMVRAHVILMDVSRNTKEGKRLRRVARVAAKYETARNGAFKASNHEAAAEALEKAVYNVMKLMPGLLQVEPKTPQGILVLAKALGAVESANNSGTFIAGQGRVAVLGVHLANALLRIAASWA